MKIKSKLTTSGNSDAVIIPKALLRASGISGRLELEAKKGQIIISLPRNPRAAWPAQTKKLLAEAGDLSGEFDHMSAADQDGLAELAWDSPSFEQWCKQYDV